MFVKSRCMQGKISNTLNAKGMLMTSVLMALAGVSLTNGAFAKTSNVVVSDQLLQRCLQIRIESTRLECYDQVSMAGQSNTLSSPKKQIDLNQTIRSAIKGNPEIVIETPSLMFEPTNTSTSQNIQNKSTNVTKIVETASMASDNNIIDRNDKTVSIELNGDNVETDNNFFLNTEVIRTYYETGSYENNDKLASIVQDSETIKSTNFDKQILTTNNNNHSLMAKETNKAIDTNSVYSNLSLQSGKYSPLSLMYDLDTDSEVGLWKPRPHNPMYLIPLYMHDNPNRSPRTPNQEILNYTQNEYRSPELKFQLSFKSKVSQDLFNTDADLWLGYTQQSHWQVYNEDNSRPFRAHDYMPELFITQPVKAELPFGGRLRMLGAGVMHHSNGEDDPLSRSWNKLYVMGGAEWGNLTVMPRLAFRLNTNTGSKPDDNPDIEDYYGYGDLRVFYDMESGKSLAGKFRLNPSTGKGSAEIDYIYPMDNNVNLFFNVFHGYGESIVDYNHEDTTVGIGVMLNDWRGL